MTTKMPLNDPSQARAYFLQKLAFTLGPMEVRFLRDEGQEFNLIDVRDAEDYVEGHAAGAINLPEDDWDSLAGLSRDKMNIVYCYSSVCHLAAKAAAKFASRGFAVMEMDGGFDAWEDHDLEIETGFPQQERGPEAA